MHPLSDPVRDPFSRLQAILNAHGFDGTMADWLTNLPWFDLWGQSIQSLLAAERAHRQRADRSGVYRLPATWLPWLLRRYDGLLTQHKGVIVSHGGGLMTWRSPTPLYGDLAYQAILLQLFAGDQAAFVAAGGMQTQPQLLWDQLQPCRYPDVRVRCRVLPPTWSQRWHGIRTVRFDYDKALFISGRYGHFPAQPQGGGGARDVLEVSPQTQQQFIQEPWVSDDFYVPTLNLSADHCLADLTCLDDNGAVTWQGEFDQYTPTLTAVQVSLALRRFDLLIPA